MPTIEPLKDEYSSLELWRAEHADSYRLFANDVKVLNAQNRRNRSSTAGPAGSRSRQRHDDREDNTARQAGTV